MDGTQQEQPKAANKVPVTKILDTHHKDFVHDVSFDFYGNRMATCSSDHHIRVFDKGPNGEWVLNFDEKAHNGLISKVTWAHPEFGQVLATCSFDHSAIVWEEVVEIGRKNMGQNTRTWKKQAKLGDSRASVQDVKFAPRDQSLKLATCDMHGLVRVYEAVDIMNLAHWQLQEEFETGLKACSALDWNPSRFDRPMLVVGGSATESAFVKIFEYSSNTKRWQQFMVLEGPQGVVQDVAWAPNLGRTYHLIAAASADKNVYLWKVHGTRCELLHTFSEHHNQVWRVKWNVMGTALASSGDDGRVRTWRVHPKGHWVPASTMQPASQTEDL